MLRREVVFGCADAMTPDVAARLTQLAEGSGSKLQLECGNKRVLLDSLIGILALECPRGTRLTVIADGGDECAAAADVASMLAGE